MQNSKQPEVWKKIQVFGLFFCFDENAPDPSRAAGIAGQALARDLWGEIWVKKGPPPLGQEPGAKGGGKERKRIWIKVKIGTGGGRF